MSLRSLVAAFADGAGSARATGDNSGEAAAPAAGAGTALAVKAIDVTSEKYWSALGGPWVAQYRRFASLISIGVGEGVPHKEYFADPFDALEFFRSPQFDRYRENETLRSECLITYKGREWDCVPPFQDDADHAVDVIREEIRRRERGGS